MTLDEQIDLVFKHLREAKRLLKIEHFNPNEAWWNLDLAEQHLSSLKESLPGSEVGE